MLSQYWTNEIEKNVFRLVEAIHSELFDSYAFDFEGNYDKLIKKFRHMYFFSVCLDFLRCRRSCEKKLGYCKFVQVSGKILLRNTMRF